MTLPTGTYTRYLVGTNAREDLIEKITNVSPEETPVISSFGRATAENTYHEWQRDTLRAANADNAALDGDDATGSVKAAPGRVANYCQIFQDTIVVSGRAEIVKKAGMKSALAYHKAKAFKELQRDMEAMALSTNPAVAGSAAVAPKSGGLGVLIYTNATHGGAGATVAHTSGAPTTANTAGTNRTFTKALLDAAAQAAFTAAGKVPEMIVTSPAHKVLFSAFASVAQNRWEVKASDKQGAVVGGADVYLSDFGKMTVVPHYLMVGADRVYGLNPEFGDAVYLRGFQSEKLGRSGDSVREQVLVDSTIRLTSETAHFAIKNLTP
jgi:hypothetical protein